MAEIEYIARISHGKDSLKMLDVIASRGLPLDRITSSDVWATDTIPADLPPMREFRAKMDERIFQMYGIRVERLCARNKDGSKRTYEQMFYHVPNRRSQTVQVERQGESEPDQSSDSRICGTRGVRKHSSGMSLSQGAINGFPLLRIPWCQRLKIRTGKHQRVPTFQQAAPMVPGSQDTAPFFSGSARRAKRNIVEYLGIAADEPARFGQLSERIRAPLVEFGIDEDLCGLYCQYNGMLGPSYETSCRDGCWFCHNQNLGALRNLWQNWPDHWALLMKWDQDSPVPFKPDHSVADYTRRFEMEAAGRVPMDNTFRWAMLDQPPRFARFAKQPEWFQDSFL